MHKHLSYPDVGSLYRALGELLKEGKDYRIRFKDVGTLWYRDGVILSEDDDNQLVTMELR